MPNANKKKNLKPKKERVDAAEFARGFVLNFVDKNSAITKADLLEKAARNANLPDLDTANFWNNIKGHIGKL